VISVTPQPPNETRPAQPSIPPPRGTAGWRGITRLTGTPWNALGDTDASSGTPFLRRLALLAFFSRVRHAGWQSIHLPTCP
jgi:hypothetical protein